MSNNQREVLAVYPTASCYYDSTKGTYKVYRAAPSPTGEGSDVGVALSDSWESQGMAWHDAAITVRSKHERRKEADQPVR